VRPRAIFLALLLVPFLAPTGEGRGTAAPQSAVATRIESRLVRARLSAGDYGVAVMTRGDRPQVVFAKGHTNALVPASVAKVVTAAAALDLLGPAHRFTTRLASRGTLDPATGTLTGDLVLLGGGDPNLSGRFHGGDPMAALSGMARAVRAAGIRRVTGALVLHEGPLDREYVHGDWTAEDRGRWYGAPVGGLSFNDNCVDVRARGGAPGAAARVEFAATSGPWRVENQVRTIGRGDSALSGVFAPGSPTLRLTGRVEAGRSVSISVPVPDPALFLGEALREALAREGVAVSGGVRRARDAADAHAERLVHTHESEMGPTLRVMNERSQNFYSPSGSSGRSRPARGGPRRARRCARPRSR